MSALAAPAPRTMPPSLTLQPKSQAHYTRSVTWNSEKFCQEKLPGIVTITANLVKS